ncbi:hypothetical protein HK439_14855 [Labrenzia aggregata]|uniref:Uncharacterized protein n=2 Tax=Roseibium aggregatum TaxID=187304 RepID=A0A926P0I5_9HYPH|nr:hypothetical protein [Roseibium aggregatum]
MADLCKILDDEHDHLSAARTALKSIVDSTPEKDTEEAINDILRPKLDNLERKFRAIARAHRMRQAGVMVGTAAMALASYMSGGILQAASAVAGASGVGVFAKQEADRIERIEDFKSDPHYLLWRLRRIRR